MFGLQLKHTRSGRASSNKRKRYQVWSILGFTMTPTMHTATGITDETDIGNSYTTLQYIILCPEIKDGYLVEPCTDANGVSPGPKIRFCPP